MTARRVKYTYVQTNVAPPDVVFPLLCPVRERDWVVGWEYELVYSRSGVAELGCVFTTPANGTRKVWQITRHDAEAGRIEFVTFIPGVVVGTVEIELRPGPRAATTLARITYEYTSLSEAGDAFLDGFTEDEYRADMLQWERELNHFLKTGKRLEA